jgi:paraquat-inducible protein A
MVTGLLIACPECGLLQVEQPCWGCASVHCARCGKALEHVVPSGRDRVLAYALAAAVAFVMANAFPIMSLEVQGERTTTTLLGAARTLQHQHMYLLATLVVATTVVAPALEIAVSVYLGLALRSGRRLPGVGGAFRVWRSARPWAMIEVLVVASLVAIVRLAGVVRVEVGLAVGSFGALMVLMAIGAVAFNPHAFWATVDPPAFPGGAPERRGLEGLVPCEACGLLQRLVPTRQPCHCARCGHHVYARKPHSISRTLALLITAYVLYLPANLLPIIETGSLFGAQRDTILSGVVYLWVTGSWALAALVFLASIVVPLAKLLTLTFLAISVLGGARWDPLHRTRLYRAVEGIGRWSMLDIFVTTLLVALVQFRSLAAIRPGPGALAFGGVVVLTIAAARTFDPRLLWDPPRRRAA